MAQFFGLHSMNLFAIDNVTDGPTLVGVFGGQTVALPAMVRDMVSRDARLLVGARPSGVDVRRAGEGADSPDGMRVRGRVYVSEQLGDALLVTVQIGTGTVQALVPHDRDFGIDEPVDVLIDAAAVFFFDPDTQETRRFASRVAAPAVQAAELSAI